MKYSINNILVPTDFTACANNALQVAIGMANRHQAALHLLHAYELYLPSSREQMIPFSYESNSELISIIKENLQKLKTEVAKSTSQNITVSAEIGSVSEEVNTYVSENDIDLVVMGTHGASGFKEYFIGTNTYDVIKVATCPVICVPSSFDQTKFHKVLYPIRAVVGAVDKYDFVKPILDKNDSRIHLLRIIHKDHEEERYKVNIDFEKIKDLVDYDSRFVTFDTIETTDIAETILNISNNKTYDLIIINATLDKKWYQFFKGNFTQTIINHCKIPIMAVKPNLIPSEMDNEYQFLQEDFLHYSSHLIPNTI